MNVRPTSEHDRSDVYEIAHRSFEASYALSPQDIELLLAEEFSPEALAERLDAPGGRLLVAESTDMDEFDTVGFAEVDDEGTLQWVHVRPTARGRGAGTALVERVRDDLDAESTPLTARLLESAREGERFLERFGLYRSENGTRTVDSREFTEQLYTTEGTDHDTAEPTTPVPDNVTVDGEAGSVDHGTEVPGTTAPFYLVYESDELDRRVGFLCSHCGTTEVAADSLDRVECTECGNLHRPDDWDAAYL